MSLGTTTVEKWVGGGGTAVPGRLHSAASLAALAAACVAVPYLAVRQPWLTAGAVFGSALLVVLLARPLVVLGLLLTLGPVDLSFMTGGLKALFRASGGLDMNGIRLIGVVVGLSAITIVNRDLLRHAFGRYGRWYVLFLLYAALTLAISTAPLDGLRLLFKLALPLLILVLVLGTVRDAVALDRLVLCALGGAVAIALLNPFYVMAGGYHLEGGVYFRTMGMGTHEGAFAFYLTLMLFIAFARFAVRGQLGYLVLCALFAVWIVLTKSRIALLGSMVGLGGAALYGAYLARSYRVIVGAIVVGALVAVPLVPVVLERSLGYVPGPGELLQLLTDPVHLYRSINWQGRLIGWALVYAAFLANPLLGLGLGSSTAIMRANFLPHQAGVVHNEWLRLVSEAGLIGSALFLLAIAAWWRGVTAAARTATPQVREFAMPAIGGLLAYAIFSITDNAFDYYSPFTQYVAFLCAGAIVAARVARDEGSPSPSPPEESSA